MSERERTTGATELKVGDQVYIGPFEIHQFRDTHMPGPEDTGNTAILTRGDHGAMSADTSLVIPAADVLTSEMRAAIGRVIETFDADRDLFIARSETDAMTDEIRAAYDRFYSAKKAFTATDLDTLRAIADGGAK